MLKLMIFYIRNGIPYTTLFVFLYVRKKSKWLNTYATNGNCVSVNSDDEHLLLHYKLRSEGKWFIQDGSMEKVSNQFNLLVRTSFVSAVFVTLQFWNFENLH